MLKVKGLCKFNGKAYDLLCGLSMRSYYGDRAKILRRGKTPLYIRLYFAGFASLHDQSKEFVVFLGTN
ncbi:hypothetical protein Pyn_21251 [Prunus yedoensis var. nudiflora]|uniref:Uncharacterized protein n=1 Tax=Prunus yedoensis var. nudiflora TaxID=2094558 RepID=A0A314XKC1_PRUYE|nr:hypothetical protein Pyn_21251 [Prunus yedoensis var. nudiflora]